MAIERLARFLKWRALRGPMYPGVELRLLRYVAALAEELNFTRAAARLRVAQPSLSKQIRDLEEYVGLKLFERTKREVRLTAAGEAFADEARQAILHAERAVEVARAADGQHKGPWTIAYSPLVNLRILARINEHLSASRPEVDIRFVSAHTSEQVTGLTSGALQAGLVILPVHESPLTSHTLYREPLILALPTHHALAAKPEVEMADLHDVPLVTIRSDCEPRFGECLERTFRAARIRRRVLRQATTQSEALQLASHNGLAALLMPSAQRSAEEGIVFRTFSDDFLAAEAGLAYYGDNPSPILVSLRTFLMQTFLPFSGGETLYTRTKQMGLFPVNTVSIDACPTLRYSC